MDIIYLQGSYNIDVELIKCFEKFGIGVTYVTINQECRRADYILKSTSLIHLCNEFSRLNFQKKANLYFANDFTREGLILISRRMIRREKVPIITVVRGPDWISYGGYSNLLEKQFKAVFLKIIDHVVAKRSDKIAVLTEHVSHLFIKRFGERNKVFPVFFGINPKRYQAPTKKPPEYTSEGPIIVTVTNFDFKKKMDGVIFLIKVMSYLLAKDKSANFYILGGGSYFPDLDKFIHSKYLQHNVHALGYKNNIIPYLRHANVFVYCTFQDAQPYAVMEAMAAGLPVIASNTWGIPEIISESKYGILVQPEAMPFFSALKSVIYDPEKSASLSKGAKLRAEELSWERSAKMFVNIFSETKFNHTNLGKDSYGLAN